MHASSLNIALLVSSKTWDLWCRRLSHPHPDHRSCLMLKFIFSTKQNLFSINIHELSKLCFLESFTIYTASFSLARYTWIYVMCAKSDVSYIVKSFMNMIETQFSIPH